MELIDTTAGEVVKGLTRAQHNAGGSSGLALNLVVLASEDQRPQLEEAAKQAAQEHPYRLLIVFPRDFDAPQPRLDAEILVGERLGPCEAVLMRLDGPLIKHAASVVMPLLEPDVPVVTCWLTDPPECAAEHPLGAVADRRITYSALASDPIGTLKNRARDYSPGDTDICWTRITYWRSLIASAFDNVTSEVTHIQLKALDSDPSAQLMASWLHNRLNVKPEIVDTDVVRNGEHLPGIGEVTFTLESGDHICITRQADGQTFLKQVGFAKRQLILQGRSLGQLLAEELRHMDPDRAFHDTLEQFAYDRGVRLA
ncbi:glucose-6-phosphate dehydrogenase assembly protein OpcA [Natronoglycomyces albus]|uniref:Glucose-6-phosphate dehydrogenase assembly protein OpcA n=1 Tax=Natronoglycomyces albus TaxID=2811108 RepID=A0A895XQN0_9ACTN|nr:glucose-6-phosphate dehydrogenase assembly protein OpcA [Natronoglycomyces albus]QSB03868.1 glucose-6-phosphate dehydrogenase assembly protein OpcA [Natronoglycomyces albus]